MPKEHGSWGMFFLPAALGLLVSRHLDWAVILLLVSASALFFAREPFLAGWRGWRRGQGISGKAKLAMVLLGLAALSGVPLLPAFPWLIAFTAIAAAVLVWQAEAAMKGQARSTAGELIAVAASMLNAPAFYYVAAGKLGGMALALFGMSLAYFAGAVFYVKMRVTSAHAKTPAAAERARRSCLAWYGALAGAVAALAAAKTLPVAGVLGYTPAIIRALYRVFSPTRELNLRQIGWSEVAYSLIWLAGTAVALRQL